MNGNISKTVRRLCVALITAVGLQLLVEPLHATYLESSVQPIPEALRGPYISDPSVVTLLDCPTSDCNGPLSFSRLIQAKQYSTNQLPTGGNPFHLDVAKKIVATIEKDLLDVRLAGGVKDGQLSPSFLTTKGARVELVGIVNRMDRQFIRDSFERRTEAQQHCGEISLIYRFGYKVAFGSLQSRLPVTMNLVFPALPKQKGDQAAVSCRDIAARWLKEVENDVSGNASETASRLLAAEGVLSTISGVDIERLELNMQAYRKSASEARDFGTEAAYLMRVFKWDRNTERFIPAHLTNQIDRSKLLCRSTNDPECSSKEALRRKLVNFLQQPAVVSAIDKGELDVSLTLGVLGTSATSISPGGAVRSNNQPYWNARADREQVIFDKEIDQAFKAAKASGVQFSFMKSTNDFRTRLNESTCTACHQTRSIAGFHFPGADRANTSSINSVFLAGSPQFYGDQPRRMKILRQIAAKSDGKLNEYQLAAGYSARPLNSFKDALSSTRLIGGWGSSCLIDPEKESKRQWNCDPAMECRRLFESRNDMNVGTCVPNGGAFGKDGSSKPEISMVSKPEIGDALQIGKVTTASYGLDSYSRSFPVNENTKDTRISQDWLNTFPQRQGNSYYGAHQEYYTGKADEKGISFSDRRDRLTGGFPAGMLRLSECKDLPSEATCGLIAAGGFNDCIGLIKLAKATLDECFSIFTSYAGVRMCSAANPCRDDYICTKPIGYTGKNIEAEYKKRQSSLGNSKLFTSVTDRKYNAEDYGQRQPDLSWMANRKMGLCIPPYFVFQFRSDGHPDLK